MMTKLVTVIRRAIQRCVNAFDVFQAQRYGIVGVKQSLGGPQRRTRLVVIVGFGNVRQ